MMTERGPESVDVIITTNRWTPYLDEAIAAVGAQTWTDRQLILVDDGSVVPNRLEAAASAVPGAIVVHQPAAGLPAGRNHGLYRATAALVAFLDDDDVWAADRLERQVLALRTAPEAIGSYSAGWYLDENGAEFGDGWVAPQRSSADFRTGRAPLPRIVTLLLRRSACLAAGGFNPTFFLGEDLEFELRLLRLGELVAVSTPLVGYRRHTGNATNAHPQEQDRAVEDLLAALLGQARRQDDQEDAREIRQFRRAFRRDRALGAARRVRAAVGQRRWSDASEDLGRSVVTAPVSTARGLARSVVHRRR